VESEGDHPVVVTLRNLDAGTDTSIRAKYVVGCDGARSLVRDAIGAEPHGDFANHAWGVVDMLAVTDFPDIRLKAAIQSADEGNILLIPREGGYMVRLYVDLGEIDPNNREAFRLNNQEKVIEIAQRALRQYTLEVRNVVWFAVYQVGQRVTDRFDDVPADQVGSSRCHASSSRVTPATPTARRPARA
jgi:phenol 2-monooxygenase